MEIIEVLEQIAVKQGISGPCIEGAFKSEKGRGYLGDVTAICIKGTNKNGQDTVLNVVVKSAPENKKVREDAAITQVFEREIFVYTTIFPAFSTFEAKRGITNRFCGVPKCYGVHRVLNQEALVLEDLRSAGFCTWDCKREMGDDLVEMVIREYARFHAISFAIKDQEPELFKQLTENTVNTYDLFLEKSGMFNAFMNRTKKARMSLHPQLDKDVLNAYDAFLEDVEETFKKLLCCVDENSVIIHADCWSNNMMFKFETINNTSRPTAVRFLDFQMCRVGSPVIDVMYFLYVCGSTEALQNFKKYMFVYYESLSARLKQLGTEPENMLSFSQLEAHWRKYSKFAMVVSAFFRYITLTQENEAVDFNEVVGSGKNIGTTFDYDIANDELYKERIGNVIRHFVKNKLI